MTDSKEKKAVIHTAPDHIELFVGPGSPSRASANIANNGLTHSTSSNDENQQHESAMASTQGGSSSVALSTSPSSSGSNPSHQAGASSVPPPVPPPNNGAAPGAPNNNGAALGAPNNIGAAPGAPNNNGAAPPPGANALPPQPPQAPEPAAPEPPPETTGAKICAFLREHKKEIIQAIVTIIMTVVICFPPLKTEVRDLSTKVDQLSKQVTNQYEDLQRNADTLQNKLTTQQDILNAQQSLVNSLQLNVQTLQGPVANLVNQVNSLNIQGIQSNITAAQQKQAEIVAINANLQANMSFATATFQSIVSSMNASLLETLATATANYAAFQAQLNSSIQLAQLTDMQNNISTLGDQFRGVQSNLSLLDQGTQTSFAQLRAQNAATQLATNATIAGIQANITQVTTNAQLAKRIATISYVSGSAYTTTSTTPVLIPNMSLQWRLLPGDSFWVYFSFTGYVNAQTYAYFSLVLPSGVQYAPGSPTSDTYLQNLLETTSVLCRLQATPSVNTTQDIVIQATWYVNGGTGVHYSSAISAFV